MEHFGSKDFVAIAQLLSLPPLHLVFYVASLLLCDAVESKIELCIFLPK